MIKKRGQSSTIAVTIAIVLGILLIVFLIWGFSTNWSNFSGLSSLFAGTSNLDSAEQACQIKCESNQVREFCDAEKKIKLTDGSTISASCGDLIEMNKISISCPNPCVGRTTPQI